MEARHKDEKCESNKIAQLDTTHRVAVSMAGHAGKAFWFSKQSGEFVTSTYYYDKYPQWVTKWNARRLAFEYAGKTWDLLGKKKSYLYGDADDQEWETDLAGFGRTFPHPYGKADGKYFTTLLTLSPAGDALTLDFAKALIDAEQIGQNDVTDYLSVSFSATDYVGHIFGPSSLESEDQIRRLDRLLDDLLKYVDRRVGLANTLIVLSSDHGAPEAPGYLNANGIEAAYVQPEDWDKDAAIARLKKQFGIGEELIQTYEHPYIYLNREAVAAKGLDEGEVERAVAREVVKFSGVALAIASHDLASGRVPDTPVTTAVLRNYHPKRSGNVYIVFEPHHYINDFDGLVVASTHGSPWRYDTFVPVVFSGHGIKTQKVVHRRVHTVDVAPTLSALLGVRYPSGTAGNPLVEVFER